MKQPLFNHSWTKIMECDELSKIVVKQKIEDFQRIFSAISNDSGRSAAENTMGNGLILHCLNRCLAYLNSDEHITFEDFNVFYNYASIAVKDAEKEIDKSFSHLGL